MVALFPKIVVHADHSLTVCAGLSSIPSLLHSQEQRNPVCASLFSLGEQKGIIGWEKAIHIGIKPEYYYFVRLLAMIQRVAFPGRLNLTSKFTYMA